MNGTYKAGWWTALAAFVLLLGCGLPASALTWPNAPDAAGFAISSPSPVTVTPSSAPIVGTNFVDLTWTAGGTTRLHCWEYIVTVAKSTSYDIGGNPTGMPNGDGLAPIQTLTVNYDNRADFNWDQTREKMNQEFRIRTADITTLPYTTMPAQRMRLMNLTEGTYYWTVRAVSFGRGWYFDGSPLSPYQPPWYNDPSGRYNNWNGSVYTGTAPTPNLAWYQKYANRGCFVVDYTVGNVPRVYAGPVPYMDITEFSNKDAIYATWLPVPDSGSGIADYIYRIYNVSTSAWLVGSSWATAATAVNIRGKPACSVRHTGLSLTPGNKYRVYVRARDRGGHLSALATASPDMTYNPDAITKDSRRNIYDVMVDMSTRSLTATANAWYDKGDGKYYVMGRQMNYDAASLLAMPGAGSTPGGDSRGTDWRANNLGAPTAKSDVWQWPGGATYPHWHVQYWGPVKMGLPLVTHGGDYTEPNFVGEGRSATFNTFFTVLQNVDGNGQLDSETDARLWEAYYDSQFPIGEYYWVSKLQYPNNSAAGQMSSPSMEAFLANGIYGGVNAADGVYDQYWLKQETWVCNTGTANQNIDIEYKVDHACEIWINSRRVAFNYATETGYKKASIVFKPGWNHVIVFYQDKDGDDGFWIRKDTVGGHPWSTTNMKPFAPFDVFFEMEIETYGTMGASYVSGPIKLEAPMKLTGLNWWETAPVTNERMVDRDYVPDGGHYGALDRATFVDQLVKDATYSSVFPVTDSNGNTYSSATTIGQPDNIPASMIMGKKYKVEFYIQNNGTMGWDISTGYQLQALWFKNDDGGAPSEVFVGGVSLNKRAGDWKSGDPPYDAADIVFIKGPTVNDEIWAPEVCSVPGNQTNLQGGRVVCSITPPSTPGFYFLKLNMFKAGIGGFGQPFGKFVQVTDQGEDFLTVKLQVADLPTGPWVDTTDEVYTDSVIEELYEFVWPGGKPEKDAVKYLRFQVNMTPFATYTADVSDYIGPTGATTASAAPAVLATPYFHAIAISYLYDATPKVLNLIPSDTRWYAGYPYGITADAYCVDGTPSLGTAELTLYEDELGSRPVRVYNLFSQSINPSVSIVDGDSAPRLHPARYYNNGQKRWIDSGTNRKYIFQLAPDFSCVTRYPKLWGRVRVYLKDDPSIFGEYPPTGSVPVALCQMYGDVHFRSFDAAGANIAEKRVFLRTVKNSQNQSHYVLPTTVKPPSNLVYYYDQADPNAVGDIEMNAVYFNGEIFFDSSKDTNLSFEDAGAWSDGGGARRVWRMTVWKDYNNTTRQKLFADPAFKPLNEEKFNLIANHYQRANKTAEIVITDWDHGADNWGSLGNATRHVLNVDAQSNCFIKFETWFYETGDKRKFSWVTESAGQVWINGEMVAGQYRSGPYDVADPTYQLQEVTLKTLAGWNHLAVYLVDVAGQNDNCNGLAYLLEMPAGQIVAYPEDPSIVGTITYDLIAAHPKPQPNGHELMDFYNNNRGTVIEVLLDGASTLTHQGKLAVEPVHAGMFWASPGDCFKIVAGKPATGGDHHYALQVRNVISSLTSEVLVRSDVEHGPSGRFILHVNHKPNIPVEALPIHLSEAVYVLRAPYSEIEVIHERDPILRVRANPVTDIDNPIQSGAFHHSRYVTDYRPPLLAPYVERTDEVRYTYAIATSEAALPSTNVPDFSAVTYYYPADWTDPAFDSFPGDTHQVILAQANLQEAHFNAGNVLEPIYFYRAWVKDEHNELQFIPSAFKRFIIDNTPPVVYDIQVYHDKEVVRLDKDESPFHTSLAIPGTNSVTLHGHVLTFWAACSDEICADPKRFKNGRFFVRKHIDPLQADYLDTVKFPWTMVEATVETDLKVIADDARFQFERRPTTHPDGLVWYAYYTVPHDAELGMYDVDFQVTDAVGNTSNPLFQRTDEVQFRDLVQNQFEVRTFMLENFTTKPETRIKSVLAEWSPVKDHRNNDSVDHYILSVGDISPQPYNTNNWVSGTSIRITKEVTIEGLNPVFFSPVEKIDKLGFTNEFRDFLFTFENVNASTNWIDGWRQDTSESQAEVGGTDQSVVLDGAFSWKSFAKGTTPNYRIYKEFDIGHNKRVSFGGWLRLKDELQTARFKVICYDTAGLETGVFQTAVGQLGVRETAWVEYFVRDASGNPYFITPIGTVKVRLIVEMSGGDSIWLDDLAFASYAEVFVDLTPPATPEPVFAIKDNHMNTGDQALAWAYWEGVPDVRGSAWIDEEAAFPTLVPANQHHIQWTANHVRFGAQTLLLDPGNNDSAGMYFASAEIRLYPKAGEVFAFMSRLNFSSGDSDEVNAKKCRGLAILLNDGVDWNAGFFWADTAEVGAEAALRAKLSSMIDAAPNPGIFVNRGPLPKVNLWRFLEVPFDDIGLAGHEIAGFAAVAWFPPPAGYSGGDSCSVQLDYVGIAAGSGVDFYYPQIKMEDVNKEARYKDLAQFKTTDLSGRITSHSGWMTEDQIFYDDEQMAGDPKSTTAIQFTGERCLVLDSNGPGSRVYEGSRIYGQAALRVSDTVKISPPNMWFPHLKGDTGGAIVLFAKPLAMDTNTDSLSELNVGIKWRLVGASNEPYQVGIAKFRAAQLRPRSLLPPKFDQLQPVGQDEVDLTLSRITEQALNAGASLLLCSDPLQVSRPDLLPIPPASGFFDAGPLSRNLNAAKWEPMIIPITRLVPSHWNCTVEVEAIYLETVNCSVAIDAIGEVKGFRNNPDWFGELNTGTVFEANEEPGVNFHYTGYFNGTGTEEVMGVDDSFSVMISATGLSGLFSQAIKVRPAIPDREDYLMQVPADGGLIVFYLLLLDEKDSWPDELMLEFHTTSDGAGFYPHRAFWGGDRIARGDVERPDAPDHYYMGPIPYEDAKTTWRALMVPTGLLNLNGKMIDEVVINIWKDETADVELIIDCLGLAGIVHDTGTYRKHFTFTWSAPDYTFYMYRTRAWDKIQNTSDWGYSALTMSQDRTPPTLVHNMTSLINYHESGIVEPLGGVYRYDPTTPTGEVSVRFSYIDPVLNPFTAGTADVTCTDINRYPPLDLSVTTDMAVDFRVVPRFGPSADRFFRIHTDGAPRPQFGETLQQVWGQYAAAYDPQPSVGYVVGEWQIDRVSGGTSEVQLASARHRLEGSASVSLIDAATLEFEMVYPPATGVTQVQIGSGDFVQFQVNGVWERLPDYHRIGVLIDNGGVYNKFRASLGKLTAAGTYPFRLYSAASNNSSDNLWMVDPQKRFTEVHYFFQNGDNYLASYFIYDSDRNFAGPYNVYVDVTPGKIASFQFYHPDPSRSKVTVRADNARFSGSDRKAVLTNPDTCFWLGATAYDAVGNIVMKDQEVKWTWNGTFLDSENRVHNYIDDYTIDFNSAVPRSYNLDTAEGEFMRSMFPMDVLVRMTAIDGSVRYADYGRPWFQIVNNPEEDASWVGTYSVALQDLNASTSGVGLKYGPDRTVYRRPMRPFFQIGYYSADPRLAQNLLSDMQFTAIGALNYSTQEVWIVSHTGYNSDGRPWLINPATPDDQARRKDGSSELTSGDSEVLFIPSVRAGETFYVHVSNEDGTAYAQSPLITVVPGDISKFRILGSANQTDWEEMEEIELVASEGFIYLKTIAYDIASRLEWGNLLFTKQYNDPKTRTSPIDGIVHDFGSGGSSTVNLFSKLFLEGKKTFTFEDTGTNEIIIKPLWFASHQQGVYAGMSGTVENDVIAGSLPWDQRYKFDNKESAGVFLVETHSALNQYTAGRQLSRLSDDWKIYAVGTTEMAFEDHWYDDGAGGQETRPVDLLHPFRAEADAPPGEYTGVVNNFYEVFLYPYLTNAPQLKSYIDHQWKWRFGGTIETILGAGRSETAELFIYDSVKLRILPPTTGYLGFREPNAADGTPGERRTEFNCSSFVGGEDSKIDGSDFRLVYIQVYDPYHQFMDFESTTEVNILMETEDKSARIIPLRLIAFDTSAPDLKARLELQESDFSDIDFTDKILQRTMMGTSELAFYGTQDVRLMTKYAPSLGRTVEIGTVRSQPGDDNLIVSFSSFLGNGSIPVLIAGVDKRKPITLRLFDLRRIQTNELMKRVRSGIDIGSLEITMSEKEVLDAIKSGVNIGALEIPYVDYEDATDLNVNSTATIFTWPNRHHSTHFEPPINIPSPVVQLVEGRQVTIKASAYDRNGNMLDNLAYFSPGWSVDLGVIQVMDDKGNHPVHYQNDIKPLPFLFSHYDSQGVDPDGGTVTVKLWGEYDFVHFGKTGADATVAVQIIDEGWIDVVTLGLFNFPCAYQELDMDKLDRDGVYRLSFWVKGYKVSDHANDDSAQIRAGLAFLPDAGTTQVTDAELFDLFRGSIAAYKNGKRFETRGEWVKLETTFTLDGHGKSLNGSDGINVLDGIEAVLLYVGTPGTAGAGAPPNYVLYDYVSVERIR